MESASGFSTKDPNETKHFQNGGIGLNSDIPFWCLSFLIPEELNSSYYPDASGSASIDLEFFGLLLQDLAKEGLIKKGNKALIVFANVGAVVDSSRFLNVNDIDFVSESDLKEESLFPDATFDFSLVDPAITSSNLTTSILFDKNQAQGDSRVSPAIRLNYRGNEENEFGELVSVALDAKKEALQGLEDILLEPPRKRLEKPRIYSRRFRYLPDLLGDSLEDFSRRFFIDAGSQEKVDNGAMQWFNENYPTRNQDFEIHSMNMVSAGVPGRVASPADVSNWLMKSVREDEFVVMKAEAEVVEEMMMRKTTGLVDELFLECNNQGQKGKREKSRRAYS
uniref:DUF7870 domain-containing protein n=1 Tax=Salix viminalis TaxID=40686 RepID=A0A6N2MIJ6_SALVM